MISEAAASPQSIQQKLDTIFAEFNLSDAPGLVVGIAQHGRTLYRRGFGLASIEHAVANTPATRMRIFSTSKQFTCLAALLLAEEGKIDVDAPASAILPELSALRGMPTLRQFMNHTSGYRCYVDPTLISSGLMLRPKGRALATQVRQAEVNFAPGDSQLYCNGGYHLLSIAIERVSGMTFEDYLTARIFEPLGMINTLSAPSDMDIIPGIATMHTPAPTGGWRRGASWTEENKGEGAIVSTIDDMLTWIGHVNGPKIVGTDATWNQMMTPAVLNNGFETSYALGLNRILYRGVEVIKHGGGGIGGTCAMLTVPAHELDLIIIANGGRANVAKLQYKIIDALLGDDVLDAEPVMADAERFKHLAGINYCNNAGVMFGFGIVEDKLGISLLGQPLAPIVRDEGDTLRVGFEDVAMGPFAWKVAELTSASNGEAPAAIYMSDAGRTLRYDRLPTASPDISEVGAELVGRYVSSDLDAYAEIRLADNGLTLLIRSAFGSMQYHLEALSDKIFMGKPDWLTGFGTLTLLKGAEAFHLTTARSRQVRFDRL